MDVRVIAATNNDLHQLVEDKSFREDLYYRLNVIPITVPPLSERTEDIPLLAMHFLRTAVEESGTEAKAFTTQAMAKLVSYEWPGNVRELKNLVYRLVATTETDLIGVEQLPPELMEPPVSTWKLVMDSVPRDADELKVMKSKLKQVVFARVEKNFVVYALNRSGWNVTRAAELVGMHRPNFHALMRKYGIRIRDGM